MDGVASYCRICALESSGSCTSCPPGNYIDRASGACRPCAPSTFLKAHQPYGSQACIPCGPGTNSNKVLSPFSFLIVGITWGWHARCFTNTYGDEAPP